MVKELQSYEEFESLVSPSPPSFILFIADIQINGDKVVVIDFWATWCGPCKLIGPHFAKLEKDEKYANIEFVKVDVDAQEVSTTLIRVGGWMLMM